MQQFQIQVVVDRSDLASCRNELQMLSESSADSNVFYEPWMFFPAIECLPADNLHVVLVRTASGQLVGFIPLTVDRAPGIIPVRRLTVWRHDYCFLGTPLIATGNVRQVLSAFLDWVQSGKAPARCVEFERIASNSMFARHLASELERRSNWARFETAYERAMYVATEIEAPTSEASTRRMKALRRFERRLAEFGTLEYKLLLEGEPSQPWIEDFLALEASGWKGREGSALDSSESSRAFFKQFTHAGHERGGVQLVSLELDGVPIAMQCNLLAGAGGYAFKVAYNEAYAKYSPGVLLDLFYTRHLSDACPHIRWIDSCASPGCKSNAAQFWHGRQSIATHLMGTGSALTHAYILYRSARHALGNFRRSGFAIGWAGVNRELLRVDKRLYALLSFCSVVAFATEGW